MAKSNTLTAIDIGTSSIKLLVGQKDRDSSDLTILAREEVPEFGLRKGEVHNSKTVAQAISFLVEKVQRTKNIKIKKAIVNINGPHLFGMSSQGLVSVSRADQKISQQDIQRVIQAAQAVNLPSNKEILEVVPQEFIIDGEAGIKDPLGLEGIRLEAKVLLIAVFSPVLENLETAVLNSGIEIEEVVPSVLASSRAVLTSEQKELGAAMIDIGAGTTSVAVFTEGDLRDFAVIPAGSANITNDIAIGLRTEIATAEKIKREFGSIDCSAKKRAKQKPKTIAKAKITIPEKDIVLARNVLKSIIKSRISEIFSEANKVLKRISKETILPAGVVLTGGGSCLPGLVEFAKEKFELPCYLSGPKNIANLEDPDFSTSAGLLLYGLDLKQNERTGAVPEGAVSGIKKFFKIFLP